MTAFDTLKQLTAEHKVSILIVEQNVAQLLRMVRQAVDLPAAKAAAPRLNARNRRPAARVERTDS